MSNRTRVFTSAAPVLAGVALALSGCNKEPQQATASQAADQLDQAATQSDPKAAAVMNKRADELRESGSSEAAGEPGSFTQDTMSKAGAAAAQSEAPAQ
jgi:hypothetical protein